MKNILSYIYFFSGLLAFVIDIRVSSKNKLLISVKLALIWAMNIIFSHNKNIIVL